MRSEEDAKRSEENGNLSKQLDFTSEQVAGVISTQDQLGKQLTAVAADVVTTKLTVNQLQRDQAQAHVHALEERARKRKEKAKEEDEREIKEMREFKEKQEMADAERQLNIELQEQQRLCNAQLLQGATQEILAGQEQQSTRIIGAVHKVGEDNSKEVYAYLKAANEQHAEESGGLASLLKIARLGQPPGPPRDGKLGLGAAPGVTTEPTARYERLRCCCGAAPKTRILQHSPRRLAKMAVEAALIAKAPAPFFSVAPPPTLGLEAPVAPAAPAAPTAPAAAELGVTATTATPARGRSVRNAASAKASRGDAAVGEHIKRHKRGATAADENAPLNTPAKVPASAARATRSVRKP